MIRIKNVMSILCLGMLIFLPLKSYELPLLLFTQDGQKLHVVLRGTGRFSRGGVVVPATEVTLQCESERYEQDGFLFKDMRYDLRDDLTELFTHLRNKSRKRGSFYLDRSRRGNRFFFSQRGQTRGVQKPRRVASPSFKKIPTRIPAPLKHRKKYVFFDGEGEFSDS